MSSLASKYSEEAFQFLGIKNEEQLKVIVETVGRLEASGEELYNILPDRLIAIAPALASPNYLERLRRDLQSLVNDKVIEAAHEIYQNELSKLTVHPRFSEARKNLEQKLKGGQGFEPIANVAGITFTPFLMGHKSPYMPVFKTTITNDKNRVLWSEMLNWFDAIFISRALLGQVHDHVMNTREMLKADMITVLEPTKIGDSLAELREALESLEKIFLPVKDSVKPDSNK